MASERTTTGHDDGFFQDLNDFHIRTDGPVETAGAPVMGAAVLATKGPNEIFRRIIGEPYIPLREEDGNLKYTMRDARSAVSNTIGGLVTLRPGRFLRGIGDALELVADPFIDLGSATFGHTRRQISHTLAA